MPLKPGGLSNEDRQYILDNMGKMTIEEIADAINRKPAPVRKFINERALKTVQNNNTPIDIQKEGIRFKLLREYWFPGIQRQLLVTKEFDEVNIFVNKWIEFMVQFKEDVLTSEKEQIKELILLGISIERVRAKEAKNLKKIDELELLIEEERLQSLPDIAKLQLWETQRDLAVAATEAYTKQVKDINSDIHNLNKSLKATRDQRFSKIESGDKTFTGLIRKLQDDKKRGELERDAELIKKATEKKRAELTQWHQFADGQLDIPILNVESVKLAQERQSASDVEEHSQDQPEETDEEHA